jgi:hypothetical protein
MIVPLNGRVCCLLGLTCCVPPAGMTKEEAQLASLAYIIRKACGFGMSAADANNCAAAVLEHADLVPKGAAKGMEAAARAYSAILAAHPAPSLGLEVGADKPG